MKKLRVLAAAAVVLSVVVMSQPSATAKGDPPPPPPPPASGGPVEFVFASGLDHGSVATTSPGMHQSDDPGSVLEWQTGVARTGAGAYHAVGGNVLGDESIDNQPRTFPFGGLEVWAGGAYRFTSFPSTSSHAWLMSTVPTDGVLGADDKPTVTIDGAGRLRLNGSNSSSAFVESQMVLQQGRWYYLLLHGRNGVSAQQQLFIYDGQTDALLERLDLTLTATGSFRNRLSKWGFGTRQDSTGLEYYLDDIFQSRGPGNPGPIRVFTRMPTGTTGTGFASVGAPSSSEAVDDCAPDADSTYIASSADTGQHLAQFSLAPAPLSSSSRVYAVQVSSMGRTAATRTTTAQAGMRVGSTDSTGPVSLESTYHVRRYTLLTNPTTGQPWGIADANGFTGIVKDVDGVSDQIRFTTIWWEVAYGGPAGA